MSGNLGLAVKKIENQHDLNHIIENEKETNIKSHRLIFKQINILEITENGARSLIEISAGNQAELC
jgi:hypothetical protein